MKYKNIRFTEYTITLKKVALFSDIVLTSREEYLSDNMGIAFGLMYQYGNENSEIIITMKEIGFTDDEILELEKRKIELDKAIPVSKDGGDNPF